MDNIIPTVKIVMKIINTAIPKSKPVFGSSCDAVGFVTTKYHTCKHFTNGQVWLHKFKTTHFPMYVYTL